MILNIRVVGDDVAGYLRNIRVRLPKAMDVGTSRAAKSIQEKAKTNVRQRAFWGRTGRLESSILSRKTKSGYVVSPNMNIARYAPVVEAGQVNPNWHAELSMKGRWHMVPGGTFTAKPMWFMRDAFRSSFTNARDEVSKSIRNILKSYR